MRPDKRIGNVATWSTRRLMLVNWGTVTVLLLSWIVLLVVPFLLKVYLFAGCLLVVGVALIAKSRVVGSVLYEWNRRTQRSMRMWVYKQIARSEADKPRRREYTVKAWRRRPNKSGDSWSRLRFGMTGFSFFVWCSRGVGAFFLAISLFFVVLLLR